MGNDQENPKQKSFEERLNQAQMKVKEDEGPDRPQVSPLGKAFQMGGELVVAVAVGGFMGYWFDKWFGTAPLFFIGLLILGFVTGVRNVIRTALQMQQEAEDEEGQGR